MANYPDGGLKRGAPASTALRSTQERGAEPKRKGEEPETHERPSSSIDFDIALDLGLAGQDVTLSPVLIGQRILDGHRHAARDQLDATGCACAGTAGVVDGDTGRIGRVEDRRIDRNGRGHAGSQEGGPARDLR